jgi:hypothetical protein
LDLLEKKERLQLEHAVEPGNRKLPAQVKAEVFMDFLTLD